MATTLTAGMLLQLRAYTLKANQVGVTTFHHQVVSASGPIATDADFLLAWGTIYSSEFIAIMSAEADYIGSSIQVLAPGPLGLLRTDNIGHGPGTGGTDSLPSQTSGLITWGTNLGGRAYKGRIYMPFPMTTANNAGGFPVPGYLVGLDAIGNEYVNHTAWSLSGGSQLIAPVLVHRKNKAGVTPVPSLITSWTSHPFWATQRKRGAFGRPNTIPF